MWYCVSHVLLSFYTAKSQQKPNLCVWENKALKMNFHRFNLYIYDMQCLLDIVVNWFCIYCGSWVELFSRGCRCNGTSKNFHHLRCYLLLLCNRCVKVIADERQKWKSSLSDGLLTLINKHKRKTSDGENKTKKDKDTCTHTQKPSRYIQLLCRLYKLELPSIRNVCVCVSNEFESKRTKRIFGDTMSI